MATAHACAALVGVLPSLLRVKRTVVGSSGAEAAALATVHQLGHPRVSEVADHLGLDLSTVSRQVGHLRQRGLLTTCPDPEDGRSQRLSVTSEGVEELRRYRHVLIDRLVDQLADWDDADVRTLAALLSRFDHGPDASPPRHRTAPTALSRPLRPEPALDLQRNA